ncbi:hypothetical protein [Streptomyces platensis]|uniref:hypothetical protein n=1 Tax=Streptomyces platensis TaxID=58346 RepID=UPI001AD74CE9|nr:hypothetical protein [Streptomyces platensis]
MSGPPGRDVRRTGLELGQGARERRRKLDASAVVLRRGAGGVGWAGHAALVDEVIG